MVQKAFNQRETMMLGISTLFQLNINNLSRVGSLCVLGLFAILNSKLAAQEQCVVLDEESKVCQKDIAIAMPIDDRRLPSARDRLQSGEELLPEAWYMAVNEAYQGTSVGSALTGENRHSDWHLVSMRIDPCAPLGKSPSHGIDDYCWPEVRLVWQPIMRRIILHARFMEATADDRAIHAIYPVRAATALNSQEAERADYLLNRIHNFPVDQGTQNFKPLSESEMREFRSLRDQVSRKLLRTTLKLRDPGLEDRSYHGIDLRPEFYRSAEDSGAFINRLHGLLADYAAPSDLGQLTSFSLPEGRQPAHLDEWVFVSLRLKNGVLRQEQIPLHSHIDGRLVVAEQWSQHGTTGSDDFFFYENIWTEEDQSILHDSVILTIPDVNRLAPVLADKSQRLVANTSCVSCHKLNDMRFDFHNFSYLEDREITVSPRVEVDVQHNLRWIKSHLN